MPVDPSDRQEKLIAEPIMRRREAFSKLLHSLEGIGALVSLVRPEYLMSKDDFLALMTIKVTRQLLGVDHFGAPVMAAFDQKVLSEFTSSKPFAESLMSRTKVLESVYDKLSCESWVFILMQICKIFIIGKIDCDRVGATVGVSDSVKQLQAMSSRFSTGPDLLAGINRSAKSVMASNIYSQGEGCLLKCISIHYSKITKDAARRVVAEGNLKLKVIQTEKD